MSFGWSSVLRSLPCDNTLDHPHLSLQYPTIQMQGYLFPLAAGISKTVHPIHLTEWQRSSTNRKNYTEESCVY